jgi:molecular chaperone GrpE
MGEYQPEKDEEQVENPAQSESQESNQAVVDVAAASPADGEVEALRDELESARAKADEYLDGWQRARADFANYKKRIERDQAQVFQNAAGNIIKRYLDIVDDLDRALKNRPQSGEGAGWADGIELIYRKFLSILESEGVKPIEAEGQPFDPNLHEAITQEESAKHESGTVIDVVQQGYLLGDRVLRPARVRVAK